MGQGKPDQMIKKTAFFYFALILATRCLSLIPNQTPKEHPKRPVMVESRCSAGLTLKEKREFCDITDN